MRHFLKYRKQSSLFIFFLSLIQIKMTLKKLFKNFVQKFKTNDVPVMKRKKSKSGRRFYPLIDLTETEWKQWQPEYYYEIKTRMHQKARMDYEQDVYY